MLQNIFHIIFILNTLTLFSNGIHISQYNETNVVLTINSKLSELKETFTNDVAKDSDIKFIKAEIERQRKCELNKEKDNESLRADIQIYKTEIQNLRNELANLKIKNIQSLNTDIQVLREDLKEQLKSVVDKQLEQQKKYVLDKDADIRSLRTDLAKQINDEIDGFLNPLNCTRAKTSGFHKINAPKFTNQTFKATCDVETRGGGWTIILRRMDGGVNFNRNWTEYKNGFGNVDGEYFLGFDKIHAMTTERPLELLVLLEDFEGDQKYETYDKFAIGNEDEQYELHTLKEGRGTAGDSLWYHRLKKFTTYDRNNDNWDEENCAIENSAAWWYGSSIHSQLTGTYNDNRYEKGDIWFSFRGPEYSLKTAIMMIRPKKDVSV